MLARRAFETHRLAPDEHVSDLLSAGAARGALRGITVRQLLEHTHGLDDSMLSAAPRDLLGRIDTEALARELRAAPSLATPGALYSYGNAGACIVAALLERVGSRPYAAQLAEALESLGIGVVGSVEAICPATGGELALDPGVLLDLVAQATFVAPDVWPDDECAGDYGFATRLPGWNPLERGIYLGWKYHGAGWLGHQSVWPGHSVLVRAHPRRRHALVAAGNDHSAAVLAARVFGAYLPELFELKTPARSIDDSGAAGRYVRLRSVARPHPGGRRRARASCAPKRRLSRVVGSSARFGPWPVAHAARPLCVSARRARPDSSCVSLERSIRPATVAWRTSGSSSQR